MKFTYKNAVSTARKFQEGGDIEPTEEQEPMQAPQEGSNEDPLMQVAQIFMRGLENQDCQMLAQGAQMFLQLLQQAQDVEQTAPAGEPVFKNGGKLSYRIKK